MGVLREIAQWTEIAGRTHAVRMATQQDHEFLRQRAAEPEQPD